MAQDTFGIFLHIHSLQRFLCQEHFQDFYSLFIIMCTVSFLSLCLLCIAREMGHNESSGHHDAQSWKVYVDFAGADDPELDVLRA